MGEIHTSLPLTLAAHVTPIVLNLIGIRGEALGDIDAWAKRPNGFALIPIDQDAGECFANIFLIGYRIAYSIATRLAISALVPDAELIRHLGGQEVRPPDQKRVAEAGKIHRVAGCHVVAIVDKVVVIVKIANVDPIVSPLKIRSSDKVKLVGGASERPLD